MWIALSSFSFFGLFWPKITFMCSEHQPSNVPQTPALAPSGHLSFGIKLCTWGACAGRTAIDTAAAPSPLKPTAESETAASAYGGGNAPIDSAYTVLQHAVCSS
ncbi:hypothetical protein Zmor_027378 [Zophobas morio]|uniref:Secreted protein n=1 Tax=Zophobas morio TaxID=2755281 RepID=A0AA38HQG0_9CUCU|nr:hypothetical protein Zmor_027378 [Zophobas morio]